jgi:hypothetical protein
LSLALFQLGLIFAILIKPSQSQANTVTVEVFCSHRSKLASFSGLGRKKNVAELGLSLFCFLLELV